MHEYFQIRKENAGPKAAEELRKLFDAYQEQLYELDSLRSQVLLMSTMCDHTSLRPVLQELQASMQAMRTHQEQLAMTIASLSLTPPPAAPPVSAPLKSVPEKQTAALTIPTASGESPPKSLQEMLKKMNPDSSPKPKADDSAGGSLQQP